RVELAYRTGDKAPLLEAYLSLGDALARLGATDKAIAVYGRVQEHDPENPRAAAALAALSDRPRASTPAAAAPPAAPSPAAPSGARPPTARVPAVPPSSSATPAAPPA